MSDHVKTTDKVNDGTQMANDRLEKSPDALPIRNTSGADKKAALDAFTRKNNPKSSDQANLRGRAMTIKHILAMKSEDGEILLGDQTDDFMASFKDGRWIADDIFEFYDLEENFWHIQDDAEIHRLMAEARAALESQSHPGLSPKP